MSEAETHETTKLLAVISVTDSEVATTGEKGAVSPVTVLPREGEGTRAVDYPEYPRSLCAEDVKREMQVPSTVRSS